MGIPAFYPDWYFIDDIKKDSSITFTSYEHLQQTIIAFSENPAEVESIRLLAFKNAENFKVEHLAKKLNRFLTDELDTVRIYSK